MPDSLHNPKGSAIDLKQRHPFLVFYLSAMGFSIALILVGYVPSSWHNAVHALTIMIGVFALWNFYRLFALTDERQRDTNNHALRFGFLATVVLSLLGGFIRGFGSPTMSWGGILALMLIAWSVGLLLFSWRYR